MLTRRTRLQSVAGRRWLGVPLLTTAMLLALAGPAAAATTLEGTGTGTGSSDINETGSLGSGLPCLLVSANAKYTINVPEGAVAAQDTAQTEPTAAYAGPLEVTITLTEPHRISPAGTFDSTSDCTGPPDAIDADITVTGTSAGGSVSNCTDTGEWTRVNTTVTFVGKGNGSCTVNGNIDPGSVTVSSGVEQRFEGNEYPCFVDPMTSTSTCPNPAVEANHVQGTWTARATNAS